MTALGLRTASVYPGYLYIWHKLIHLAKSWEAERYEFVTMGIPCRTFAFDLFNTSYSKNKEEMNGVFSHNSTL